MKRYPSAANRVRMREAARAQSRLGEPLTERQKEIVRFFAEHLARESVPPTIQQIADAFEITTNGVFEHLLLIAAKGFIVRSGTKMSRSWRLTSRAVRQVGNGFCPCCGKGLS